MSSKPDVPPPMGDLGKSVKDLLSKNYIHGTSQLTVKTLPENHPNSTTNIKAELKQNHESKQTSGNVELTYDLKKINTQIKEKWSTDNQVTVEMCHTGLMDGLKLTAEGYFKPKTETRGAVVKTAYKRHFLNTLTELHYNAQQGNSMKHWFVIGKNNYHMGYQTAYDFTKSKMTAQSLVLQKHAPNVSYYALFRNGTDIGGGVWHRVRENLQVCVDGQLAMRARGNTATVAVGFEHQQESDRKVKFKVDSAGEVGLSVRSKMAKDIFLTVGAAFDVPNIEKGSHRLGFGLDFEV